VGTWNEVKLLAKSRTKNLSLQWKEDLEDIMLPLGPGELMQILLNLTLNAIDAIRSLPSPDQWIALSNQRNANQHVIRLENGGPPIPPAIQAKLFQRGFSTKGTNGSGIGLAVCRRLAQKAGGDFSYDSSALHPCFILSLPMVDMASPQEPVESPVAS
jgi:signal transduction histidine kinase